MKLKPFSKNQTLNTKWFDVEDENVLNEIIKYIKKELNN